MKRVLTAKGTIIIASFGLLGAVVGALIAPHGTVCWNILFFGDCFERGSTTSILGAAVIGGALGALSARAFLFPPADNLEKATNRPANGTYQSISSRQPTVPCPYCGRSIPEDAIDCLYCEREVYDALHNR